MYPFAPFLILSFSSIAQAASTPARHGLSFPLTRYSNLQDTNGIVHVESLRRQIDHGARKFWGVADEAISPFHPGKRDSLGVRDASEPLTFPSDIHGWTCKMKIGATEFNVLPDSGSADVVIASIDCTKSCENITNLYDPKLSGGVDLHKKSKEEYGSGTATGELYQDTVSIAGLTAEHQTFTAATEYTGAFGLSRNFDGLLGLAYPSLSRIEATPVLQTLVEGKQIANAVFGVSLAPSCSELHLGGINSKYSDQDFTYVDVVGEEHNPGYWMVKSHDISLDKVNVIRRKYMIIDTGTSLILAGNVTAGDFYNHIPDSSYDGDGFYLIPCDFNQSVTIRFSDNGSGFTMPPNIFNLGPVDDSPNARCVGAIIGSEDLKEAYMIIGGIFLQQFYTQFNFDKNQVGLAALREC